MKKFEETYKKLILEQAGNDEANSLIGKTVVRRVITLTCSNGAKDVETVSIIDEKDTIARAKGDSLILKNHKDSVVNVARLDTVNGPVTIDVTFMPGRGEWYDTFKTELVDKRGLPVNWVLEDAAPSIEEMKEQLKDNVSKKIDSILEAANKQANFFKDSLAKLD